MVYVCDAVMGSGKTSATIEYINAHPYDRYVYITPYLDEANRIATNCPRAKFRTPDARRGYMRSKSYSKREDARWLIENGCNIASTHALFKSYDADMLQLIKENGYKLIIDENVDIIEPSTDSLTDINMLVSTGYLREEYDEEIQSITYALTDKEYQCGRFNSLFKILKSRKLTKFTTSDGFTDIWYYWTLPPELISSFSEVIILTYLFEGQGLSHMLNLYDIQYKNIGVIKSGDRYTFDFEHPQNYVPAYVSNLKDMIDIVDDPRYNAIGDDYYSLSMNWFSKEKHGGVQVLSNKIYNCFRYLWRESEAANGSTDSKKRLWGSYQKAYGVLARKGYKRCFACFNARATNLYKEAQYLVYVVNLFVNVRDKRYYEQLGIYIDDEKYALSTMLQWIWRSAIRDGKPIHIYIPSKRMRELLIRWIDSFSEGGEGSNVQLQ